jgi:hypothetical protein
MREHYEQWSITQLDQSPHIKQQSRSMPYRNDLPLSGTTAHCIWERLEAPREGDRLISGEEW